MNIEHLLTTAADDSDQPLHTDVETILHRGRRSVRRTRVAAAATAVLTAAAIVGGITVWSAGRPETVGPADQPTITVKSTGEVIDNSTGTTVPAPPPVSPLSDAEILQRCAPYDETALTTLRRRTPATWDQAGPINSSWKVAVKSGDRTSLDAMIVSPESSVVMMCAVGKPNGAAAYGRLSTTHVPQGGSSEQPDAVTFGTWIPAAGVSRVLVDPAKGPVLQALVGTGGFYSVGFAERTRGADGIRRIRAYDAAGRLIWKYVRATPSLGPPAPARTTVKVAAPIVPKVVLTKDPESGKKLAPPPPVSPLADDQVRTRCATVDAVYLKNAREKTPPVGKDWKVVLKTGTGDKLTALLVSPDGRMNAWCHMLGKTAAGSYDYTRGQVRADGKFADNFSFGMVPEGVAQIVVDLPKEGPTRALIANGYYIWGLTGGNSNLQDVRVRGYDADGKLVYDQHKQVDVDFD